MSDPTRHDQDDRLSATRTDDGLRPDDTVRSEEPVRSDDTAHTDDGVRTEAPGSREVGRDPDRLDGTARHSAVVDQPTAREVRREQRDRLGGIRWGAVFFGWLCATGVAVLLVAIVAATGTAIGLTESTVDDVVDGAVANAATVSLAGAIAIVVVLAVSYLAGGYVAARMARFSGRSQGFGVWVLGLVVTLLAALAGLVLGSAYDVFARLDLPRIPVDEGNATTGGLITLVAVLVVTLLAAVLGGQLGDRYHRRLDEIDLR